MQKYTIRYANNFLCFMYGNTREEILQKLRMRNPPNDYYDYLLFRISGDSFIG